jgi:hypothetical protein
MDIFMLLAAGFVIFGSFIGASYIPDALFGGTTARYDAQTTVGTVGAA